MTLPPAAVGGENTEDAKTPESEAFEALLKRLRHAVEDTRAEPITEANTTRKGENKDLIELRKLICILGTACHSYLFATLVEPDVDDPTVVNRRIIKMVCDVELQDQEKFTMNRKPITVLRDWFLGIQNIIVRYPSWQARGTHVEIRTPDDTEVTTLSAILAPETLEDRDPARVSRAAKNPKALPAIYESYGFYASSDRVQITKQTSQNQPVTTLSIRLSPIRSSYSAIASLWALLVTFFSMGANLFTDDNKLTLDNQLGIQGLSLAVMAALYFPVSRHCVSARCWRSTRSIIWLSLLISMLAPLTKNVQGNIEEREHSAINEQIIYILGLWCDILLVTLLVTSIILLAMAVIQQLLLGKIHPSHFAEHQMKVEFYKEDRTGENFLGVTETGVYSTHWMRDHCGLTYKLEKPNASS